jgi:Tetratricopeptide repeat
VTRAIAIAKVAIVVVVVAVSSSACHREPPSAKTEGGSISGRRTADLAAARHAPLSPAELGTTDGDIAVGNFDSQLEGIEHAVAHNPAFALRASLVEKLLARGQLLGRVADYERAAALADELVRAAPKSFEARLLRADARATFHEFASAITDLEEAAKLGAPAAAVDAARAAIFQATGRDDEALALRKRALDERRELRTLALYATALADVGRVAEAEDAFIEAQYGYRDVSPLPVAWLYLQHAIVVQRAGRLARARELLEAAHARLPAYAPATGHLAAVLAATGERERAAALLRPLVERSDDPEYWGQLATLDSRAAPGASAGASASTSAGTANDAVQLRALAAKRYDELIAKHPAAFADHAARFWLDTGGDAKKALALAQKNLATRQTRDAWKLAIEAALAAKDPRTACRLARDAASVAHPDAALHVAAAQAYTACGDKARADVEMSAVK